MQVASDDKFEIKGLGTVHVVNSPVFCHRSTKGFIEAAGSEIEINGEMHKIVGVETHQLGKSIEIGERIGILV